jgi:aquaporin NIP
MQLDLKRRLAAEAIGTFALVTLGCGAVVANARYDGALGLVGVAVAFGLAVCAVVYAIGHLSGAHINPAVTIAFACVRHMPAREALAYVAAQLLGAIAAGLLLLALWPDAPGGLGTTTPSVAVLPALVYEGVLTAFLMFVVMAVATDVRAVGAAAAIAIGATVALDILTGGPVTGASMNPARSLGPALASGTLGDLWIYLVGPTAGALAGAFGYQAVRGETPAAVADEA